MQFLALDRILYHLRVWSVTVSNTHKVIGFRSTLKSAETDQGLCPQTPVIGSRSRARHVHEPSHFSFRSDAYGHLSPMSGLRCLVSGVCR